MTKDPSSLLRKWYFCVNEAGLAGCFPLIAAAVASAKANTSLEPICIYGGADEQQIARLTSLGITVVRHVPSFDEHLRLGYGADHPRFSGHWLRVDLPLIDPSDDLVLYTDVDVLFLAPPRLSRVPRLIAAGPEFDRENRNYFNSGVMALNLRGLRSVHADFTARIRARLEKRFKYPAHDQQSFNEFFGPSLMNRIRGRVFDPLGAENNWKPFWGNNPETTILHFHGPKPWDSRAFANGTDTGATPHRKMLFGLWQRAPDAYAQSADLWDRYAAEGAALAATPSAS